MSGYYRRWFALAAVAVMFASLAAGFGASASPTGQAHSPHPLVPTVRSSHPLLGTHGDLIVGPSNSPYTLSPATVGGTLYGQAGNITVQPGGTLNIRNLTVDFLQFVGDNGTAAQRLSHRYTFLDQGTVQVVGSTITTDANLLNAYTKLNLTVSAGGKFSAYQSVLGFPGWVTASGAGSSLTLNSTWVVPNTNVFAQRENQSIYYDTISAPVITASSGAQMFLNSSLVLGLDRDNSTHWGSPGPLPFVANLSQVQLNSSGSAVFGSFHPPTDPENLTRDALYPTFAGAQLSINYSGAGTSTGANSVTYSATNFPLGALHFPLASTYSTLNVSLPAGFVGSVNAGGIAALLQSTGMFGGLASLSASLGTTNNPVTIHSLAFNFLPASNYNITVNGAGTSFTAVNSLLGLNWNLTAGTPVSQGIPIPQPWGSNKLELTGGATAFLANLSVPTQKTSVFWNQSVVIPDALSSANFYRWAAVPVSSAGNVPVPDAQVTAFYAYSANQSNNATATALNLLSTADPVLGAYATNYAKSHGLLSFGSSGLNGVADLLLADSVLTQATLPDGTYLGGYHFLVTLAGGGPNSTRWGYGGLSPYPLNMTPAAPDGASPVVFPSYLGRLGVSTVTVTSTLNGYTGVGDPIGSSVQVNANITNFGSAPISTFTVGLYFVPAGHAAEKLIAKNQTIIGLPAGGSREVTFLWAINETTVGLHGYLSTDLAVYVEWNGGNPPNGGETTGLVGITVAPALITFAYQAPTGTLNSTGETPTFGTVTFAGKGNSEVKVYAIAPNGAAYQLSDSTATTGPFEADLIVQSGMPSGVYSLDVSASYNNRTVWQNFTNQVHIGAASSNSANFLTMPFFGLALWLWIVIAGAIVGGSVGALLVMRSLARGRTVECGECGQLIPEDATACRFCGAEFETDLVRCSRCGSTIPADSKVCPECSAFLLGNEATAAKDPERQAYGDYVERFRAQAKKELGDNYGEGAFWDWWKRQPTYMPFSQFQVQQAQGGRAGMTAPIETAMPASAPPTMVPAARPATPRPAAPRPAPVRPAAPAVSPRPTYTPPPAASPPATIEPETQPAPTGGAPMKACPNCGKEILPDYLVCPFCGAVTG